MKVCFKSFDKEILWYKGLNYNNKVLIKTLILSKTLISRYLKLDKNP